MRSGLITRLLFISYCLEAGMFLLMVPWSPAWDRTVAMIPMLGLGAVLRSTFGRATLSGFGAIHLIWGIHDLDSLWPRKRSRRMTAADADSTSLEPADEATAAADAPAPSNPGV